MSIELTLRRDKGAALTHDEADDNLQTLSNAIQAVEDRVDIAIADDGTLKSPGVGYGAHTGGSDAYSITVPGSYASLDSLRGIVIQMRSNFTNDGACTLAVNGLAATAVKKDMSFDPDVADIVSGQVSYFAYNGSTFQLLNPRSKNGTNYGVSTGTADALKVEFADVAAVAGSRFQFPSAAYPGYRVSVKANATNTASATLTINLVSPAISLTGTIKKNNTDNLIAGDLKQDHTYDFQWDGSYWQLMTRGVRSFRQTDIAIPSAYGKLGVIAHGLGRVPDKVIWRLKAKGSTAVAHEWSTAGQFADLGIIQSQGNNQATFFPISDATNLDIICHSGSPSTIVKRDTNTTINATLANIAADFYLDVHAEVTI